MPHLDKLLLKIDDAVKKSSKEPKQRKGIRFEIVCKTFLENDTQYKDIYKNVELTKPGTVGIDLVATEYNGSRVGIQCKHEKNPYR